MILDSRLTFGSKLVVTGTAGAKVAIGDVIDLGAILGGTAGATALTFDIGIGEDLWFVVNIDTTIITGGGAGTVAFSLNSNATADLASTPTEHFLSAAYVTGATSAANITSPGTAVAIRLPAGSYQRYLVLGETIGSTTITAGKINAFITKDFAKNIAYPNAVNG